MQPYLPSQKYKGLIHVKPKWKDYKRGGRIQLAGVPLQTNGQWDDFIPPSEAQRKQIETNACVSFGTNNAEEILKRRLFKDTTNNSDRFLARISNTTLQGNDPSTVAEARRKKGFVKENDYPYPDDIGYEEFFQEIPENIKTLALANNAKYAYGHQWVEPTPEEMMSALLFSPLGVDVSAWMDEDGIYKRFGRSNHWTVIYGYEYGKYWKCYDSYFPYKKKLDWNFGFTMVKEYTLSKQVVKDDLFTYFLRLIRDILGL